MHKGKKLSRRLCLLLAALLLPSLPARAAVEYPAPDEAELTARVEQYLDAHGIAPDRVAVGVYDSGADAEAYYNGDVWFYPASMYKVPLAMVWAAREAAGELTAESAVGGLSLEKLERLLLVNSNNEYAHAAQKQLGNGSEPAAREYFKALTDLPEDYYDPRFCGASFFTARYMTRCMKTLYADPAGYPRIMDCLYDSLPQDQFFRASMPEYKIAQKYGVWEEWSGATAIVASPVPVIITVMCRGVFNSPTVIAELGRLALDYALEGYDSWCAQVQAEEAAALAEQERLAAEEAAAAQAEQERLAAEEEARLAREEAAAAAAQTAAAQAEQDAAAAQEERRRTLTPLAAILAAAAVGEGAVALVLFLRRRKKAN